MDIRDFKSGCKEAIWDIAKVVRYHKQVIFLSSWVQALNGDLGMNKAVAGLWMDEYSLLGGSGGLSKGSKRKWKLLYHLGFRGT